MIFGIEPVLPDGSPLNHTSFFINGQSVVAVVSARVRPGQVVQPKRWEEASRRLWGGFQSVHAAQELRGL